MQITLEAAPMTGSDRYGGYDGSNDAAMVFHEYTHGITDRLVTDAGGFGALTSRAGGRDRRGAERLLRAGLGGRARAPDRRRRAPTCGSGSTSTTATPAPSASSRSTARRVSPRPVPEPGARTTGAGGFTSPTSARSAPAAPRSTRTARSARRRSGRSGRGYRARPAAADARARYITRRCGSPRPSRRSSRCATRSSRPARGGRRRHLGRVRRARHGLLRRGRRRRHRARRRHHEPVDLTGAATRDRHGPRRGRPPGRGRDASASPASTPALGPDAHRADRRDGRYAIHRSGDGRHEQYPVVRARKPGDRGPRRGRRRARRRHARPRLRARARLVVGRPRRRGRARSPARTTPTSAAARAG